MPGRGLNEKWQKIEWAKWKVAEDSFQETKLVRCIRTVPGSGMNHCSKFSIHVLKGLLGMFNKPIKFY